MLLHPTVEGVVEIKIGQQGTYHSLNAKGNFCFERKIEGWRANRTVDFRHKK